MSTGAPDARFGPPLLLADLASANSGSLYGDHAVSVVLNTTR
ncbi:hypothetical protein ACFC06_00240 [Nocardia sp. NPDC056064]